MHHEHSFTFASVKRARAPNEQVDDFAVAQRTPLPVCLAGVEGDKVCRPDYPRA